MDAPSRVVERPGVVVVCGATGRQGGGIARHLLAAGWPVRALSRKPDTPRARALRDAGAEVVGADMADRASLDRAVGGAYGVFNVQNPQIAGFDGEVAQGRNVAEAARAAGVQHVVYGSAGMGTGTGVPSWDSKVIIADHMRQLGLPITVLRPMAFMELMTDKDFYPQVSVWHVMPKLMGWDRALPWLAADDVGVIGAAAFGDPNRFVGKEIPLAGDVKTLGECRQMWTERGNRPRGFPMPVWLFERVAGKDLPTMWRWLREHEVPLDTDPTLAVHPGAQTMRTWLDTRASGAGGDASTA
ncbi:MAG TPA: NmrA/HSCARG family protein [Candidatus Limnocylindrales bacterium]|nr:NmrA/HSCARG family protein [Candidatus Limnocylindrales bacterium]